MIYFGTGALLVILVAAFVWSERVVKRKGRKTLESKVSMTIIVMAAIVTTAATQFLIVPKYLAFISRYAMDIELMDHEVFRAIKQYSPQEYERLLDEFVELKADPATAANASARVVAELSGYAMSQLPVASDEAAMQFNKVIVRQLRELRPMYGNLCYYYLFPDPAHRVRAAQQLSESSQTASMTALAAIVKSAASGNGQPPDAAEILPAFEYMVIPLEQKYGDDWYMLAEPRGVEADKEKICEMMLDLYENILAMPPEQSGKALRYMFTL